MSVLENSEYDNLRIQRHISVIWKIKHFSARHANTSSGLSSSKFYWYGCVWCLTLYPKGNIGYKGEEAVSVCITKTSPSVQSPAASVTYKIGFKDKNGNNRCTANRQSLYTTYMRHFSAIALIRTDKLFGALRSELLGDDTLTVFCEMNMGHETAEGQITSNISVATSTFAKGIETLANDFESLYRERKNCDVVLQAGDESLPAHKIILAARSDAFSAMFSQDMPETSSDVVNITDISAEVLKDMLNYIYTGDVQDFSFKKACALYPVSDKYALTELKAQCAEIMLGNLCINSICDVALLADRHTDARIMDEVKSYVSKNAPLLLSSNKWADLLQANPRLAAEILQVVT